MSWRAAPSIAALQRDLDEAFSQRTRPDWIIGDPDHSSRVSDHNPDGKGMVHAIDIRLGGDLDPQAVLNATIGDPRVWYVIHDGKIYSRTYGFEARQYNGSNPHTTHIHVSIRYTQRAENDTSDWGIRQARKPRTRPVPIDLSEVQEQMRLGVENKFGQLRESPHIKRVQRALNARAGADLKVDGYAGERTLNAWGRWERKVGGKNRPRVPDPESLRKLVQPRWRVVR